MRSKTLSSGGFGKDQTTDIQNPVIMAIALSFGAAVALGLSRFSYGLLLPPMREDLSWSYLLAGGMNTANAVGYLLGVLLTPPIIKYTGARSLMVAGSALASVFVLLPGYTTDGNALLIQRLLSGTASSFIFIAGGVLAAKLASMHTRLTGLILGLYYSGTGIGIMLSALIIPVTTAWADNYELSHAWQWSWRALAASCLIATLIITVPAARIGEPSAAKSTEGRFTFRDFFFSLSGYFMFGVGYIGYMTFVAALLKEQGISSISISIFYFMLGFAVLISSRVWAGLLDRYKGGQALAILNAILAVACILPVLTSNLILISISGFMFGGVFLSVVASTTALVRHNLPAPSWPAAISAFTGAFALGQIIGPTVVGGIADTPAGLKLGLLLSAVALLVGAVLSIKQKALKT